MQTVENSLLEENRISGNTVGVFFESGHGNRLLGNQIELNHIGIHVSDSSDGNVSPATASSATSIPSRRPAAT